MGVLKNQAVR